MRARVDKHRRSLNDGLRASERECALQECGFGDVAHVRFYESRRAGAVHRGRRVMPVSTSEDTTLTSHSGWSVFAQGLSEGVTGLLLCWTPTARATGRSDCGECRQRARRHG
jgi:hypothetical protein